MKKLLILILLVVFSVGGYASSQKAFEIKRGINLDSERPFHTGGNE